MARKVKKPDKIVKHSTKKQFKKKLNFTKFSQNKLNVIFAIKNIRTTRFWKTTYKIYTKKMHIFVKSVKKHFQWWNTLRYILKRNILVLKILKLTKKILKKQAHSLIFHIKRGLY